MLQAIIFDFDGVLYDSEHIHYQAYCPIFAQYSFAISYDVYVKQYLGLPDTEIITRALTQHGHTIDESKLTALVTCKVEHYRKAIGAHSNLSSVKDLAPFLITAQEYTKKLAICSNSQRRELETVLAKLEQGSLKNYFQTITTVNDVKQGKPAPDSYLATAKKLGVAPEQCLVIEDSRNGIKAAKAANMTVAALISTHEKAALTQADYIVERFHDIPLARLFQGAAADAADGAFCPP